MIDHICTQITHKMVSFLAKLSFKLHKMSGEQIESSSIPSLFLGVWCHRKLFRNPCFIQSFWNMVQSSSCAHNALFWQNNWVNTKYNTVR